MTRQLVLMTLALGSSSAWASSSTTLAPGAATCDPTWQTTVGLRDWKTNLKHRWCATSNGTYSHCNSKCCEAKEVCGNKAVTCTTKNAIDYQYSASKATAAWTKQTEDTACCDKVRKCDTTNGYTAYTCPSLWETTGVASTCSANVCKTTTCCKVTLQTCAGQLAARTSKDTGSDMVKCSTGYEYKSATKGTEAVTNVGAWKTTCCTVKKSCIGYAKTEGGWANCDANFYSANDVLTKVDDLLTLATTDDTDAKKQKKFQSTCCVEKKKCTDVICDASKARISNHNNDGLRCIESDFDGIFSGDRPDKGCDEKCCKDDPFTCRGYDAPKAGGDHNEWGCWPSDQFYLDAGEIAIYGEDGKKMEYANGTRMLQLLPKTTNKVDKDEDYKEQCCTPKLSCEVWKDPSMTNYPAPYTKPKAQASAANQQHAVVAASLLMAFGVIVLS